MSQPLNQILALLQQIQSLDDLKRVSEATRTRWFAIQHGAARQTVQDECSCYIDCDDTEVGSKIHQHEDDLCPVHPERPIGHSSTAALELSLSVSPKTCAWPLGGKGPRCKNKPLKGLTMCRKHQPFPAKKR